MSKLLLHYRTTLGPRTIIAEIGDNATARAVLNAHQGFGEQAALVEEVPRHSLSEHLARHKRKQAKAALRALPANVTVLDRKARP